MKRVFISAFLCMSIMSAICSNGNGTTIDECVDKMAEYIKFE